MSDSYERSYYEIALTNGQVLVALGILLGCVLGAFLSGMWVAKQALDEARQGPAGEPVASIAPEGEAFEFFGKTPEGVGQDTPTAGQQPASSPASPPVTSVQQLRPLPVAAPSRDRDAPAQMSGAVARSVEGEPPASSRPAAAEPAAGVAETAAGKPVVALEDVPVIQVFSSNDQAQAAGLVERLRGADYRAFLSPVEVDGRTMYRVRVGPFSNRQEAEAEAEKVKREFKLDTWITTG